MGVVRELTAIDGGAKSVDELEFEALEEIYEVAHRHLAVLSAARSPWKRWIRSVANTAGDQLEWREEPVR